MKSLSRFLPFLLAASLALPSYGQQQNGSIVGRVLDRDGKTPLQGVVIWIDSLFTETGRNVRVRERLTTKTGRDGRYSMSGLYQGRARVTVVINNQPVMVKGDAIGDEIFLVGGTDTAVNFDLSKAPAAPPPVAATAPEAAPAGLSDKEREELREKFEKEAAARGVMDKAFEAGKAAFNAKNYDEAVTQFKSAISQMPTPPPAGVADILWANLAKTHDAKREYTEAAAAYNKAIEYKPTESNYYLNLSLAQIGAGQLKESEDSIKKAAELNPANAGVAYYNLGATLINRNQYEEALVYLKKAIELDPKYANAYYQAGLTLIGKGEMAEARGYLEKYLSLAPNGPDADVAKALIEETKKTVPQSFTSPEAEKKAQDTKTKTKTKQ
jgi:tetratricopeptide (TPR) repeat protein